MYREGVCSAGSLLVRMVTVKPHAVKVNLLYNVLAAYTLCQSFWLTNESESVIIVPQV